MALQREIGGAKIEVVGGDLTRDGSDAIVNAANSSLMGGGGVDGAIHRAGGPEILEECKAIVARQGRLPTGQAVITTAGSMPAKHVIHTVGPVYSGKGRDAELLASCHSESLKLAAGNGLSSVAFPAISCGVYGYPLAEAAPVALGAVARFLTGETSGITRVRFVLFGDEPLAVFEESLKRLEV
jgi:O-acetyl-ADP-ribose deacetylase (regulator of RNase III)